MQKFLKSRFVTQFPTSYLLSMSITLASLAKPPFAIRDINPNKALNLPAKQESRSYLANPLSHASQVSEKTTGEHVWRKARNRKLWNRAALGRSVEGGLQLHLNRCKAGGWGLWREHACTS